jgi:hypothetical protein
MQFVRQCPFVKMNSIYFSGFHDELFYYTSSSFHHVEHKNVDTSHKTTILQQLKLTVQSGFVLVKAGDGFAALERRAERA